MPPHPLAPGPHTFHSPSKNLTFEYIIHTTPATPHPNPPPTQTHLIIIHPPAWGLGSEYLQHGLSPLLSPSPSPSPSPSAPPSTVPNPRINRDSTLLYFHPRGTGNSTRPSSQTQMSTFTLATDLEDLRVHLHLPQLPTLMGHSNGGAVALAYAEMYPDRVARLVLLGSQVLGARRMGARESMRMRRRRRRMKREGGDVEVERDFNLYIDATEKSEGHEPANEGDGDDDDDDDDEPDTDDSTLWRTLRSDPRYSHLLSSTTPLNKSTDETFTASVHALWPIYFSNPTRYAPELRSAIGARVMSVWCYEGVYGGDREYEETGEMVQCLGDVQAKTLIINGREDWICRVESAERLRDGIPGARLVVCDECGHFPWIEARERTMEEIRGFIVRG